MYIMQQVIQGVAMGSVYGLIAIGYVLIWNTWGVLNFAQGEVVMIGAFSILILRVWLGLPWLIAFPGALLMCMLIGYIIEVLAFRPLIRAKDTSRIIATLGVGIFLRNLYRVIFGADPYAFPSIFGAAPVHLGGVTIVPENIWNMAIGFGLVALLSLFLKKTNLGKAMRATAQNRDAARLMGINVKRCMSLTFVIASGLGGFAGMLVAPLYFVMASMGQTMGTKGYASAVFGGISSTGGSMVGGMTLGLLESLGAGYVSSAYQSAIAFLVLFLVIIFKPSGLLVHDKHYSRKV